MTPIAIKAGLLALSLAFVTTSAQAEVALFLKIKTQEGQREKLVELWDQHLKSRAEESSDHVSYVFALDMNDPNIVHISEVYATQAAFQANAQAPWFAAYMAEVGPLLAGEPAFAMADPHWIK